MNSLTSFLGILLFKKIFFIYIIFAFIITGLEINSKYNLTKDNLIREFSIIEKTSSKELSRGVFNFDRTRVSNIVNEIVNTNNIVGVSIKLLDNEVVYQKGLLSTKEKSFKSSSFDVKNKVLYDDELNSYNYFLQSNSKKIAKVSLYYEKNIVFNLIKNDLIIIGVATLAKFIVLFFLFIYFIYHIITSPLKKIIEATRQMDNKNKAYVNLDNTKDYTELNELADSFNYMSKRIFEEFTKVSKLNAKLKKQKTDLVEANEYKNFFLANISHELKTPLNPIVLISSVMLKNKNSEFSDKTIEDLKIINKSSKELKILIDDILDLTKIEAGDITLNYENVNIKELFISLTNIFKQSAQKKSLDYEISLNLKDDYQILDARRFNQICRNLINNAIKFTNEGFVKVELIETQTQLKVNVIDSGIGIKKENIKKIFTSFKQLDASTTRKYGGTGLGLAISKELAKLHDGDILVESVENEGSCFSFIFDKKDKSNISCVLKKQKKDDVKNKENLQINSSDKKENYCNINTIIINNDPLLFFKLGVFLKKDEEIKLTQLDTLIKAEELIKKDTSSKYILIIEVMPQNKEYLEKLKSNYSISLIGIGQSSDDVYDYIMNKPIENENLLTFIKKNS
ncbi:hypothetical protein CRU98_03950 [Arcobacter sp. CECT 8986]|uniref:sensor histidine kinase n=1 Tax=Arcobacter sp. CECT 8986 TaxID=2044507 RepID=UPI001009DCCC|nr:HAMP domain-containing sensor histidine kinase [Arcobacter sp. CECT 8986]RXK00319.1 hypothetical protein CRU98_03950 [Arcobacter sp. CECT 8986]